MTASPGSEGSTPRRVFDAPTMAVLSEALRLRIAAGLGDTTTVHASVRRLHQLTSAFPRKENSNATQHTDRNKLSHRTA